MRIGGLEIALIVAVVILLFGSTKLPELSRSIGRSLRIFKAETRGLLHDDDDQDGTKTGEPPSIASSANPAGTERVVPPTGDGAVAAPANDPAER